MRTYRLGDDVDDFCTKCKRLTNHSIVSLVSDQPAKVRCRTCYSDHDYRRGEIPPSKKDLKKQQLFNEVLSTVATSPEGEPPVEETAAPAAAPKPVRARKTR
jgi:hypothetical protein